MIHGKAEEPKGTLRNSKDLITWNPEKFQRTIRNHKKLKGSMRIHKELYETPRDQP